jgi:hypothetical protein
LTSCRSANSAITRHVVPLIQPSHGTSAEKSGENAFVPRTHEISTVIVGSKASAEG